MPASHIYIPGERCGDRTTQGARWLVVIGPIAATGALRTYQALNRSRQFKLSKDPAFVDKFRDVVGLYVDPPAHTVVLSVDEKSRKKEIVRKG
jgi:hypothetical protein